VEKFAAARPVDPAAHRGSCGDHPLETADRLVLLHRTKRIVGMANAEVKGYFVRRTTVLPELGASFPNV
jgi:hypothetical protein